MSDGLVVSYEQKVTVSVKEETTFVMRESDWVRIRARVERLKKQRREFSAAAWTFVGLALSAVLTMFTWAPAFKALEDVAQREFAWVWPALVGALALGVLMSIGMFWAAHVVKDAAAETIHTVAGDMDDIHDVRALIAA